MWGLSAAAKRMCEHCIGLIVLTNPEKVGLCEEERVDRLGLYELLDANSLRSFSCRCRDLLRFQKDVLAGPDLVSLHDLAPLDGRAFGAANEPVTKRRVVFRVDLPEGNAFRFDRGEEFDRDPDQAEFDGAIPD